VTAPRGEASNPPSWENLEHKLRRASRLVATPIQQEQLLAALRWLRGGDHQPLLQALTAVRFSPD